MLLVAAMIESSVSICFSLYFVLWKTSTCTGQIVVRCEHERIRLHSHRMERSGRFMRTS